MNPEQKTAARVTVQPLRAAAGRNLPMAGFLISLMIATAIINGLWAPFPSWPSGLFAWCAAALLISRVSAAQLLQIGALLLIGIMALCGALYLGSEPSWLRLLDSNAPLLSMIGAVSFLRLVAMRDTPVPETLPHGPRAFQSTVMAVALLGSFINISAPILIGDRIAQKNGLSNFAAQSITRIFSGCPAWSPFFGGMAVVLTYISNTHLLFVMLIGLPFAVIGLLLVIVEARIRYRGELENFAGYPITLSSLWLPLMLAACVGAGYVFLPSVPILIVIAMAALSVTAIFLLISHGGAGMISRLWSYMLQGLSGMVGELLLFISAGVLAVGLRALVTATHFELGFSGGFDAVFAGLLLASLIIVSALGAHPVVFIAVVTPLLAPINPDPQLLAVTYLFGWSMGTCSSPLSGTHLVMQGRFGISSVKGAMRNWPFVAVMYLISLVFLKLVALIQGI